MHRSAVGELREVQMSAEIIDFVMHGGSFLELLSASNSLIIRENTGNFFIFDSEMPLRPPNYAGFIGFSTKFPTQRNREF